MSHAHYHIATATRTTPVAALFRSRDALLAHCVERRPTAAWSADARARAHVVLTARNALLHFLLTGNEQLTSTRVGALIA